MRVPSTELNKLISSLTGTEKSYFKKFAAKNFAKQKNYLGLFDIYNKYKEPTDVVLRKSGYIKHLSRAKNYLHDVILKVLRNYHNDSFIQIRINEHLHDAEILNEKLLFTQALKSIEKAKNLAVDFEMLNDMLDVLWWERHVTMRIEKHPQKIKNDMERIAQETDEALALITRLQQFRKISDRMHIFINSIGSPRKQEDLDTLNEFMSSHLLLDEKAATTYWPKLYYYQVHYLYSITLLHYENACSAALKILEVMESRPNIANEHMYGLMHVFNYILASALKAKKFDVFEKNLKKLRDLPHVYENARTLRSEISIFEIGYNAEITRALKCGDFDSALKAAEKISRGMEKFGSKMQTKDRLQLCLNISKTYFGLGNYKLALSWLNKVVQDHEQDLKENLFIFTKIFNLIIHVELKNDDLIPYILKSTLRSLDKNENLHKVESEILDFIKKHPATGSRQEMTESFTRLKNKLLPLEKDPFEKIAFEEFNYLDWIESKITGKKLGDVVKEKEGMKV